MPLHVVHRSVAAALEPTLEMLLVGVELGRCDAELREAELTAEPFHVGGELIELCSA
jgi:hypothetical protein